jgi:hypothetical protein
VTREPDSSSFDAIVAAWRAEGNVPQWPDDPHLDEPAADARTGVGTDARAEDAAEDAAAAAAAADAAGGRSDTPAQQPPSDPRTDPDGDHRRADAARADPGPSDAGRADAARADPGHPDAEHADPEHADPGRGDSGLGELDQADAARADPGQPGGSPGPHPHAGEAADGRGAANGERQPARAGAAADPNGDEHFVPPEPPPLPRMGPPILVGLTLIVLGLLLVTFPGWVGVPQVYGLPLGLVAIAAGLGWLVLRLWPDPDDVPPPLYLDDPDDPDGGAVL